MSLVERIARWRVALGFVFGAMVFWLARPTWPSLLAGGSLAIAGEVVRIWAAGHIEKSREVTSSGPYRWIRHPLYLGTTIIAVGIVIASRSWVVAGLVALYVVVPLWSAIRAEEAHLPARRADPHVRIALAQKLPGLPDRGRRRGAAKIFAKPFTIASDQIFQLRPSRSSPRLSP